MMPNPFSRPLLCHAIAYALSVWPTEAPTQPPSPVKMTGLEHADHALKVDLFLSRPAGEMDPESAHFEWCLKLKLDGWRCGNRVDFTAKTHPFLRPWRSLPRFERARWQYIGGMVNTFRH